MSGSKNYGKWYAMAQHLGTVTTDDLCDEISHSTTVTEADVRAVFTELKTRLSSHLKNSEIVRVDGLGSFAVGLRSKLVDNPKELGASKIKGYRIIFRPESEVVGITPMDDEGNTKRLRGYKALKGISIEELKNSNVKTVEPAKPVEGGSDDTGK